MIYGITNAHFEKYIHHKAYGELEAKALATLQATRDDLKGMSWAEMLGVEEDIAPKSLLRVEGSDGVIDVRGILVPEPDALYAFYEIPQTAYRDIKTSIAEAAADPRVERLVMNLDTPGGYVSGGEAAAIAYRDFPKPTVSRVGDMAASMGYWFASQGDTIEATAETSIVGSIGVVVDTLDFSGWEEEIGIKSLSITNRESTDKRPDLSTDHGVEVLQDELDQIYEVFKGAVVAGRSGKNGFTAEAVGDLNGRVVAAKRAEELGLVDSININTKQEADTMAGKEATPAEPVVQPSAIVAEPVAAPVAAAAVDTTAQATADESHRINEILVMSGVQLSDGVKSAIKDGTTAEAYAVSTLKAQAVKPTATMTIPVIPSAHVQTEVPQATEEANEKKFSSVIDSIVKRNTRK